ncbi:MAG TPA: hypothetical protein VJN44_09205, partial [Roseateles sp.]|nr:hypothetical protein [Roseateles sp.]
MMLMTKSRPLAIATAAGLALAAALIAWQIASRSGSSVQGVGGRSDGTSDSGTVTSTPPFAQTAPAAPPLPAPDTTTAAAS